MCHVRYFKQIPVKPHSSCKQLWRLFFGKGYDDCWWLAEDLTKHRYKPERYPLEMSFVNTPADRIELWKRNT